MHDYSTWVKKSIKVTNLHLDKDNPRIPDDIFDRNQAQLIAELIEHDEVYELAKSICNQGYFPNDTLIAIKESNQIVVVEGNRRLAALKLLISPDIAPEKLQTKFRRLSETISKTEIAKVDVYLAPTRESAIPLIVDRHTHEQISKWKPAMQAKFIRSQLDRGYDADSICQQLNISRSKLNEFIRTDMAYRIATNLDLPDKVKQKVINPRQFPVSTLERMLETSAVRDFLAVEYDDDHIFIGKSSKEDFKRAYSKIVIDISTNTINSRTVNSVDEMNDYLKSIGDVRPYAKKGKAFEASDLLSKPQKAMIIKASTTHPRITRRSASIIPSFVKCEVDNFRIRSVFRELKSLKVDKHVNSTALMMRTLLELCLSNYIDNTNKTAELRAGFDKKGNHADDWYPTLRQQLTFMDKYYVNELGIKPLELKALRKFSQKSNPLSHEILDGYVHNKHEIPTEPELRSIWEAIEALISVLLSKGSCAGE